MYAYGIDSMDVCLCGILFGLNTNKNSTKISQLPICAYTCCSGWVFQSKYHNHFPLEFDFQKN